MVQKINTTTTALINSIDDVANKLQIIGKKVVFWVATQKQAVVPHVRAARPFAKRCVRGFARLVKFYLLWVVAYTVMEHFEPGLAGEIFANLGKVWEAIVEPVASCSNVWEKIFYEAFMLYEDIWAWLAAVLPFLAV